MRLVFTLPLLSTGLLLTFLSFLSLRTFEIVFQGQTGCTGPGGRGGDIAWSMLFSLFSSVFSSWVFILSPQCCLLVLFWVLLGKALKQLKV